jgi:NAD-dependent SIR2 family protein deacetylase
MTLAYFGTPVGWRMTPGIAWRSYLSHFYAPIAEAAPHDGHRAIGRLEKERFGPSLSVITMNVDGCEWRRSGGSRITGSV